MEVPRSPGDSPVMDTPEIPPAGSPLSVYLLWGLSGLVPFAGAWVTSLHRRLSNHSDRVLVLETKLETIKETLNEVKDDVKAVRNAVEYK